MTLAHKTISNAIANFIGSLILPLSALIITPFTLSQMGTTQYGIYALFFSILSLLNFLDFGLAYGSIRFIVEANEKKDYNNIKRIINTNLFLFLIFSLIITVVGFITLNPIVYLLHIPLEYVYVTKVGIMVTLIALGTFFLSTAYRACLQAFQKYIAINVVSIVVTVIVTIVTLILLYTAPRLDVIIAVTLLMHVLTLCIFWGIVKKIVPGYRFEFTFDRKLFNEIFHFSSYTFVIMICYQTLFQVDKFFITRILGATQLSYYAIPRNVASRMHDTIANINNVLFPLATELITKQKKAELILLYQKAFRVNVIGLAAMSVPLFIYSDEIIGLWLGEQYINPTSLMLKLAVIGYVIYTLTSVPASIIAGLNMQKKNMFFFMAITISNIILLSILLPNGGGLIAASYAFIFAHWCVPIMYIYCERKIGVPMKQQLFTYLRTGITVVVSGAIFYQCIPLVTNLWNLIIIMCLSALLVIVLSIFIILDANDRKIYFEYLKKFTFWKKQPTDTAVM